MNMRMLSSLILLTGSLIAAGCGSSQEFVTDARKDNGLVIILPGIEGESPMNRDVRLGLVAAGVNRALPIYPWGRPIPIAGMFLNQVDVIGNRLAAIGIARMITRYQDDYPGRPVHIIGHSGGGGVAVFAAEALPEGRQVDGLILLSASISNGYNLTKALSRSRNGLVNFYSEADVGFLVIGTIIAGNVDGMHGPAAGATGFRKSRAGLHQIALTDMMTGGGDVHAAATRSSFVSTYVASWVLSSNWPVYAGAHPAKPLPLRRPVADGLAYMPHSSPLTGRATTDRSAWSGALPSRGVWPPGSSSRAGRR